MSTDNTQTYQPSKLPSPFTNLLAEIEKEIEEMDRIVQNDYEDYDANTLAELLVSTRHVMRTLLDETGNQTRDGWVAWLLNYGPGKFFDAFMEIAQGAESVCRNCDAPIYLDIAEGGGVPDWRTEDGDYGCFESPDTNDEGTGGHLPPRLSDYA